MSGQDLERLALGEPAATLWRECRAALREAFDALPGGPREWRFGGGTILAARWGHRTSFDIDLTVAPEMDVDALLSPDESGRARAPRPCSGRGLAPGPAARGPDAGA